MILSQKHSLPTARCRGSAGKNRPLLFKIHAAQQELALTWEAYKIVFFFFLICFEKEKKKSYLTCPDFPSFSRNKQ